MSERKYPHLSNMQLIKLLGCVRIMNHKNYPDEFKDLATPYGHDLIDTIVERLSDVRTSGFVKVDLNFLFRNNHELRNYIGLSLADFHDATTASDEPFRDDNAVLDEILQYIEEHHLVMKAADYQFTLFFAPDVRAHGLTQCGAMPDWSITQLPLKGNSDG